MADVPAEARAATVAGAEAFGRYYFEQLSSGIRRSDSSVVKLLSDAGCEGCRAYTDSMDLTAASAQSVETAGLVVRFVTPTALQDAETTIFVDFDAAPFTIKSATGAVVQANPGAKKLTAEMRCRYSDSRWLVLGLRLAGGSS